MALAKWLDFRGATPLAVHRASLIRAGVLRRKPGGVFRRERHFPDPAAREALISAIRTVHDEDRAFDERALLLSDLLDGVELVKDLGLALTWRERLDRARGAGSVADVPEDLRDTSTVLGAAVPSRQD